VLAWRPLLFIGQRSYSWYLFHWPLLVFARVATLHDSLLRDAALALVALLLSDLAFRWVERPLRTGRSVATALHGAR
jgi:peptidoglycan/LPS O-acetylase OafA/YrhL